MFGIIILSAGTLLIMAFQFMSRSPSIEPSLKTYIISLGDGYGYQILMGGKLIVRQEYIPAIAGKCSFRKSKDAQIVADLVMHKLTRGQEPVVTLSELHELNIVTLMEK